MVAKLKLFPSALEEVVIHLFENTDPPAPVTAQQKAHYQRTGEPGDIDLSVLQAQPKARIRVLPYATQEYVTRVTYNTVPIADTSAQGDSIVRRSVMNTMLCRLGLIEIPGLDSKPEAEAGFEMFPAAAMARIPPEMRKEIADHIDRISGATAGPKAPSGPPSATLCSAPGTRSRRRSGTATSARTTPR